MSVGDSCVSVCASVGMSTAKKTDMKYERMREHSDYLSLFKKLLSVHILMNQTDVDSQ